jgi:thiosulfate/3-mercaptopyruvate sulfurtransferase
MKRCLVLFLLVWSACAMAQSGPAHPEMLVSTQWLADHLKDSNVVLLHVAEKRSDYQKGHIPGARYLGFDDFMDVHVPKMYELPSPEKLKEVFEKLGIGQYPRRDLHTGLVPLGFARVVHL